MEKKKLSIVICTYGRINLLQKCIDSFKSQIKADTSVFEVIIINNLPSSESAAAIRSFIHPVRGWKYGEEHDPGLSRARNKGLSFVEADWIGFIDDDAVVPKNFIKVALETIENQDFDCFGGSIKSWWVFGRPRWLSINYGEKPPLSDRVSKIKDGYNWGSNIFFKRNTLVQVGGFPTNIGMAGNRIGYSAENLVQIAIKQRGGTIGYNPDLVVNHAILKHKLHLNWHIRAAYAEARDGRAVFPENYTLKGWFRNLKAIVRGPVCATYHLLFTPDFFVENFYLETFKPWASLFGRLRATA